MFFKMKIISSIFFWIINPLAQIKDTILQFIRNYPKIEGEQTICAYTRKQNFSILEKYIAFTIGVLISLPIRYIEHLHKENP